MQKMRSLFELRRFAAAALGGICLVAGARSADAQLYWDVNGTNAGATDDAGGVASGTWNATNPFWTTDSTGITGQDLFVSGSAVVFSAGTNATGTSTVTINTNQTTGGITVEEGTVTLAAGVAGVAVVNGAGPVRIHSGATLSIATATTVSTTAGSVVTLDGGTLRNTLTSTTGQSFWDSDSTWELTSNGGTVDVPVAGASARFANSINLQSGTAAAALTKTGVGEFRATAGNFTTLNVNQGLYRIDSLAGTETGFGSASGTVNLASGAAVGTSVDITSPATRSFSLGAGASGATFVTNAAWTIDSPIGGPGGFVLNGNGFPTQGATASQTLTLAGTNTYGGPTRINIATLAVIGGSAIPDGSAVTLAPIGIQAAALLVNASETIGSLAGGTTAAGVVNVASGTLTTGGDNTSTTFAGQLTGAGNMVKAGAGMMTLTGAANTLGGTTTVSAGTLCAASIGSLSGYNAPGRIFASSGGTLAVRAGGSGEWAASDIDTFRANATFAAGSSLGIDTSSASFAYGSAIAGALGVTKIGGNTLTLSGVNTYTGGTAVTGGTLLVANADAPAGGSVAVADGASVQAQAGLPKAITLTTLATNSTGKFDLADNSMVIRNMTPVQVRSLVQGSFNLGHWNGATGLNSSTAATDARGATGLGYATAGFLSKSSFKGVSPLSGTDVLVRYTYYGDADLSGATTLDDFTLFLIGLQNGGTTWVQGDFDYSGLTTLDDFNLFLRGYQQQGAPLEALESLIDGTTLNAAERSNMLAALQAIPEPNVAMLLTFASAGVFISRSRKPK
jgi:autotransporter-associated beta strand protein